MRITVHVPDDLETQVRITAADEKRSISSVVSDALKRYIDEKRRRMLGAKMMELAGTAQISSDVYKEIEVGREDHDRT